MKSIGTHNYFVYIITNKNKTVLYTGITNNLSVRLYQHLQDINAGHRTFTARYNVYCLLYWERFEYVDHAIAREKQIKGWTRKKKEDLINSKNPDWNFLNNVVSED